MQNEDSIIMYEHLNKSFSAVKPTKLDFIQSKED